MIALHNPRTRYIVHYCLIFLLLLPSFTIQNVPDAYQDPIQNYVAKTCKCEFCNEITANSSVIALSCDEKSNKTHQNPCRNSSSVAFKKRTIMIYIAADNDLSIFAARNIKQMAAIGSNEHMNILVHLDIRITGNKKITRRYYIEKDTIWHVNAHDSSSQCMDSGNPATLISFCEWGISYYPAEEYDLFLWNHGTGILEPVHPRIINPAGLFIFNPETSRLDLDRSVGFMDLLSLNSLRGVCWDDSTGHYLSNRKLDFALNIIHTRLMKGKKFGVIVFDACLMSMIEVACFVKKYAKVMVGSQEVELGMGLNYAETLAPLAHAKFDTFAFAKQIVIAYENTYKPITNDYTYSAINLNSLSLLETNIDHISQLLFEALSGSKRSQMNRIIHDSRNKTACTHFDEPSYIDLHHFYVNLLTNLKHFNPSTPHEQLIKNSLTAKLEEGIDLINSIVIANVTGKNLKNAHGISIYFPERNVHSSYQEAEFFDTNTWGTFLSRYLFG